MTKPNNKKRQQQGTANSPRSLKLSQSLIDKVSEVSKAQLKNDSDAVLYALLAHSGKRINVSKTCSQHMLLIPEAEDRLTLHSTSVRIPDMLYADLQETAKQCGVTVQDAMILILVNVITQDDLPRHALRVPGSKRDRRMQDAISKVLRNCHYDASVEPCGGALEIHQNFNVADKEIICDIDTDKVNFYKVIQKQHRSFVSYALSYAINKQTFIQLKDSTPRNKVEKAVRYFYLCLNSVRKKGEEYQKLKIRTYWNAIAATYTLHTRLQATLIFQRDIFKTLSSRNLPKGKTLLIVDPPYVNTNAYPNNMMTYKVHERLSERLLTLYKKGNRDFLYFCRITYGHNKSDPNGQILKQENDQIMRALIDDLYFGHGLYYIDIPLDSGVIERIITSFSFKDAKFYGKKVQ